MQWRVILLGAAGGAGAIALMEFASARASFPVAYVPFATSIVLVMGSPEAEASQPRALVGGHLISSVIGLGLLALTGPSPWSAAAAVGLAMMAMHLTRTFHPPAGIDPLVIIVNNLPWTFLLMPVAAGAGLLALFAYLWHAAARHSRWPQRWW